jgi:O-antigen ligase
VPPGPNQKPLRWEHAAAWLARVGCLATLFFISHSARWLVRDAPARGVFAEHSSTLLYLVDVPLFFCLIGWLLTPRALPARLPLVFVPTLGLAALSTASALWADARPGLALEIGARLALLTGFGLYLASGQAGRWLPTLALIGGAAFQAAIAGLQFVRGEWLGLAFLGEIDLGPALDWMRGYGLTVHPNLLARHLTLGLFAALGGVMATDARRHRAVVVGLAGLIATGMFVTFSRAAWLGAAVGGAGLLIGLSARRDFAPACRRLMCALALLVVLGLALVARYWGLVRYRWLGPLSTEDGYTSEHIILSERAYYADVARRMIADHPLLGVGAGNFSVASLRYDSEPRPGHLYQPAHNTPLLVLAELGPVGLILWLSTFGVVAWGTVRALRYRQVASVWILIWAAALLALGIADLFDYVTWADQRGRLMWLAALGLWANETRQPPAISPPDAAAPLANAPN